MNDERRTMNGKPVFTIPAKSIINFHSGFGKKLLCDDLTFSTGTACAYSCAFCYVPAIMARGPQGRGDHAGVVVRRESALETLRSQLVGKRGKDLYSNPSDQRVIYASPLVDVAANMELVRETVEACLLILKHTYWRIRLLSKSNLLTKVAEGVGVYPDAKERMIFGVSTGEFDDKLAAAYEGGTPLVSKRIASLHKLQDEGWRTFGMICPSLPQEDYAEFSAAAVERLRPQFMEHVWSEIINVRGESMDHTVKALYAAYYEHRADNLKRMSADRDLWEQWARSTFEAHLAAFGPEKLRFLQYVKKDSQEYWSQHAGKGAVLL